MLRLSTGCVGKIEISALIAAVSALSPVHVKFELTAKPQHVPASIFTDASTNSVAVTQKRKRPRFSGLIAAENEVTDTAAPTVVGHEAIATDGSSVNKNVDTGAGEQIPATTKNVAQSDGVDEMNPIEKTSVQRTCVHTI